GRGAGRARAGQACPRLQRYLVVDEVGPDETDRSLGVQRHSGEEEEPVGDSQGLYGGGEVGVDVTGEGGPRRAEVGPEAHAEVRQHDLPVRVDRAGDRAGSQSSQPFGPNPGGNSRPGAGAGGAEGARWKGKV